MIIEIIRIKFGRVAHNAVNKSVTAKADNKTVTAELYCSRKNIQIITIFTDIISPASIHCICRFQTSGKENDTGKHFDTLRDIIPKFIPSW